jgi:hypothetical protein
MSPLPKVVCCQTSMRSCSQRRLRRSRFSKYIYFWSCNISLHHLLCSLPSCLLVIFSMPRSLEIGTITYVLLASLKNHPFLIHFIQQNAGSIPFTNLSLTVATIYSPNTTLKATARMVPVASSWCIPASSAFSGWQDFGLVVVASMHCRHTGGAASGVSER